MTPEIIKKLRHDIGFTQELMAETLGMSGEKALQKMESGKSPVPRYIYNSAMTLNILNENKLLRKHLKNIGVDLKEKKDV
jgi:transcriptional regulator with XRE-family HTH domain